MKHSPQRIALAAAISALLSSSAIAQSYPRSADSGYNPSGYILPSINGLMPDSRLGTSERANGVGFRFGTTVSPSWDMQLGLQYAKVNDGANRYEQMTLGLDALYLFSRSRFRPLLLVGVGAERDQFTTPATRSNSTSPYVGLGAGFQFAFNDQWGMQLDVRRNHARLNGNNFASRSADTDVVSLGIMYTFSKTPPPRVAQAPVYVAPPAPVEAIPAPAPPPPNVVVAPPAPAPATALPAQFERMTISASKLFNFDSAELRTPMPKLDEVADALIKFPDANNILISGYTDRLGAEAYNQTLSQKRADAVKGYMINRGVAANRMTATGKGESNPIATCTDKNLAKLIECLEPNRRVEVEQITIERRVQ